MTRSLTLLLALALSGYAFAEDSAGAAHFRSFHWERSEREEPRQITLAVFGAQKGLPASKPGRVRVNVEPGCLLPDAIVEALPGNRCRFEFPDDDYFSIQARRLLGLKGKACIIRYEPGEKNLANKVLEVTEVGEPKTLK